MTKVTRQDFITRNANKSLDLAKLRQDSAAGAELSAAGSSVAKVGEADLNRDGKISGSAELTAVFKHADGFDRDGSSQSLISADSGGTPTAAGRVLSLLEARMEAKGPRPDAIATAARDRIARFGPNYGVDGTWISSNPNIPGNRRPDTTQMGLQGHWKCNLFAMDSVYQAGFATPHYGGTKGWYPVAVDLPKYTQGANKFFDKLGEIHPANLTSDELHAQLEQTLRQARPGDLIIVNHPGPDAADGGHCRVVVANNYDQNGTVDCAQASFNEAVVRSEDLNRFVNEEVVYLLRPNKPRPQ